MYKYLVVVLFATTALAKDKESPTPNPDKQVCTEKKEVKGGKSGDTPKTETTRKECKKASEKKTAPEKGNKNY